MIWVVLAIVVAAAIIAYGLLTVAAALRGVESTLSEVAKAFKISDPHDPRDPSHYAPDSERHPSILDLLLGLNGRLQAIQDELAKGLPGRRGPKAK